MGKILIAEDDEAMRLMVTDVLGSAGHSVTAVADGTAAIERVRADPPDLVVLDYRMGRPDGFEVCRMIKSDPRLEHLPVLLLTAERDLEDRIQGFEAGADDYLSKPFDARELIARARALLRLSEQGRSLNPTTGLPGNAAIEREFERRAAGTERFTLCYLDLDFFKPFNDRFGFPVANRVIEGLGRMLRDTASERGTFAGHIGGDDFVLMCDDADARPAVENLRHGLGELLRDLLDPEIVSRGYYIGRHRDGEEAEIPLTRLAAALLRLDPEKMPPLARLGEVAADAKQQAKRPHGDGIVEVDVGT